MEQDTTQGERFEPERLYLQWLNRRQVWPIRMDRVMMPWLWGLVALLLIGAGLLTWADPTIYEVETLTYLAGIALGALLLRWLRRRGSLAVGLDRLAKPWLVILLAILAAALTLRWLWLLKLLGGTTDMVVVLTTVVLGLLCGADVYVLWMNLRRISPLPLGRITGPWLRRLAYLFLVLWMFSFTGEVEGIMQVVVAMAAGVIIGLLPLAAVPMDFLLHVPRCVHRDTDAGMIQPIWHAPIPTAEIVRDLRRWAVVLNLKHLAPSATFLVGLLAIAAVEAGAWPDPGDMLKFFALGILPIAAVLIATWWFLLGCGLAAAGLPRWWTSAGGMFLLWVLPVLIGVFLGGTFLALLMWWERVIEGLPHHYEWSVVWFCGHYLLLLLVPLWLTWRRVPQFMDSRRQGRWM